MKLALLGTGSISEFHVRSLRSAGFDVVAAAASNQSTTVSKFCAVNSIPHVYMDPVDMLSSDGWNALVVAIPTNKISAYEDFFLRETRPIMIEKPAAHSSKELQRLKNKENIVIGYNRRHYDAVGYVGKFLRKASGPFLVKVSIPETFSQQLDVPGRFPHYVYENSVHVFDLLNFLFGEVDWKAAEKKCAGSNDIQFLVASGEAHRFNATIMLDMAFGCPQNFAIEVIGDQSRVVLSPLEVVTHFEGMEVIEPSESIPIRQYKPRPADIMVETTDQDHKPGFLIQSQKFFKFARGSEVGDLATVADAMSALAAPEKLWELTSK